MKTMLRFLFLVLPFGHGQDFTDVGDVHVLSELSLGKLLELRSSFGEANVEDDAANGNVSRMVQDADAPQAMALQVKKNPKDRGGGGGYYHTTYHYDVYKNKKDKNSIQSIFQISVTTLAFLAFGAYLLCLLIHAIKGKSEYYDMPEAVTQMVATYLANRIKKTKALRAKRGKKKRPQRQTTRRPQTYYLRPSKNVKKRRPSGGIKIRPRPKRSYVSTYVTEDMYEALVRISQAYTKYHTVDYTYYNTSFNKYY